MNLTFCIFCKTSSFHKKVFSFCPYRFFCLHVVKFNYKKIQKGVFGMNFSKDFKYNHTGDYLYPVEYYQFRQSSTLNTFKIELLCFDDSYAFHLISENELIPQKYRIVAINDWEINEEFGFELVDSKSKQAVLQRAIDMASAIAKKYCENPVKQ